MAPGPGSSQLRATRFIGSVDVSASAAKVELRELVDEIISVLTSDPHGSVSVTLEISGEFPQGVPDRIRRAVTENAGHFKFKNTVWE